MIDIKNKEFISQVKVFSGIKIGSISPTDIDGFLDFGNKLFIFIEAKYGVSSLKGGQKLALERLCDACQTDTRTSILIITNHLAENDIDVGNTIVQKYRYNGKWFVPKPIKLKDAVNKFHTKFVKEKNT
jgi:hypothetical protein